MRNADVFVLLSKMKDLFLNAFHHTFFVCIHISHFVTFYIHAYFTS